MSAFGHGFVGGISAEDHGRERLHWTLRPFWHHLRVQAHDDGISVTAVDDLPVPVTLREPVDRGVDRGVDRERPGAAAERSHRRRAVAA